MSLTGGGRVSIVDFTLGMRDMSVASDRETDDGAVMVRVLSAYSAFSPAAFPMSSRNWPLRPFGMFSNRSSGDIPGISMSGSVAVDNWSEHRVKLRAGIVRSPKKGTLEISTPDPYSTSSASLKDLISADTATVFLSFTFSYTTAIFATSPSLPSNTIEMVSPLTVPVTRLNFSSLNIDGILISVPENPSTKSSTFTPFELVGKASMTITFLS